MEAVKAVCTPPWTELSIATWENVQHQIYLVGEDDYDETHLCFDREEDVEPTLALLAEEGVYMVPYSPIVEEFYNPVDWG